MKIKNLFGMLFLARVLSLGLVSCGNAEASAEEAQVEEVAPEAAPVEEVAPVTEEAPATTEAAPVEAAPAQ